MTTPSVLRCAILAGLLLPSGSCLSEDDSTNTVDISSSLTDSTSKYALNTAVPLDYPGESAVVLQEPSSTWVKLGSLEFDVNWPANAPTNAQILLHVKDWEHLWYQNLLPQRLKPGVENHFHVDMSPAASAAWKTIGHHGTWNLRSLMAPREFGISLFCNAQYKGTCSVENVKGILKQDEGPPRHRKRQDGNNKSAMLREV